MKRWWLLVLAAVAAVAVYLQPSEQDRPPDDRVGARLARICPIAKANIESPLRGVDALGRYLADNTPMLLHDFAEVVVMIERIDDPRRHDRRAEAAHLRMFGPVSRCHRDLERFAEAIEQDEAATERWAEGSTRVVRTIGILLGETPASLRDLSVLLGRLARREAR